MARCWAAALEQVLRIAVGAVFAVAGVAKLRFARDTNGASLVADWFPPGTASFAALAVGEIALGLWLGAGWKRWWAGRAAIGVLAVFTVALAAEMTRANPRPCGCFAVEVLPGQTPASVRRQLAGSATRNVAMIAAVAMAEALSRRRGQPVAPERAA